MTDRKQKLELTWIGKENRPKLEPRILLEDPEKSYHAKHRVGKNDIFDNRLIFGDNLLALKALEAEFAGRVKCVFIDPPYNTGSAFEHYDDGIEHSLWLSLMRDRLGIIRKLLSDDGSLWIEPKPIRVFLQDGTNDLNSYGGNWWLANQEMERALSFAGYEVNHAWGDGGHDGKHATAIFPEAMKWLWRDWPAPVKARRGSSQLLPGEDWQLVGDGYKFTEGPAADRNGVIYFNDIPNNKTYRVGADGKPVVVNEDTHGSNGQAFGPDGRRYVCSTGTKQLLAFDTNQQSTVIAEDLDANDLVVLNNGDVYVTCPEAKSDPGTVWLVTPDGTKRKVDSGLIFPNGVTASPDQSLLYVTEFSSHWVWSYQIQPDGSLKRKQRFFRLHVPDTADSAGADGIRVDREGRLYVATRMGIQVCDPIGRVTGIIPTPNGKVSNVSFGGPEFDELYAACGERVYKRKVKAIGANAWDEPNKPKAPAL